MTIWKPTLDQQNPRYQALADAIALDVKTGRLKPGDRLPPHRALADVLGVTVGTVSRGYAEAERRGLTMGEVGRGTYIRGNVTPSQWPEQTAETELVDLTLSLPVRLPEENEALKKTLVEIAEDPQATDLLAYQPQSASEAQRKVAAAWLEKLKLKPSVDRLLITGGSQHGLNVVLSSVFRTGQVILTEALTYPSIKSQARSYGIRLRGVGMDHEGLCPDALDRACRQEPKPAGLYVVPTLQNPTSAIQSIQRRREIVEIAAAHGLLIIEDDVHSYLLEDPPTPLAAIAPDRVIYLSSVAKCLAPGLRVGLLIAPPGHKTNLAHGVHDSIWMPPPLMVEVTTRWMKDGTAERIIGKKRAEMKDRQKMAQKILGKYKPRRHPSGYQIWLDLPEPWHTDEFVSLAREEGVLVVGAGSFAVSRRHAPHGLRLAVGIPSRADLERGLKTLDTLLSGRASSVF